MKKGKLDSGGRLYIERKGGNMKETYCPYGRGDAWCGHWCPLFGEPYKPNDEFEDTFLDICNNRTLRFDTFEDEREGA